MKLNAACLFTLSAALVAGVACTRESHPAGSKVDVVDANAALCFARAAETPVGQALAKAQAKARAAKAERADAYTAAATAWIAQARDAAEAGDYLNARACAELALAITPAHRGAQNVRLLTLLNDHAFAEARDLAREMLKADPDDQMTWGSLSDALLELGDLEGATAAAQKMVDLRPNLPSYARASYLAWLQGDVESAKLYIREAHRAGRGQPLREPEAWVLTEAARIFWHEGDLDGAEAGYDLALTRRADYPEALAGKAQVALARGEPRAAAAMLERSYAKKPSAKTAWLLKDAYMAAGETRKAMVAEERLKKLGRLEDPFTWGLFLASTSTHAGELEKAAALLEKEHAARPGLYTRTAYAFALARVGRAAEAQALVDEVVELGTPDAELVWRAGFVRRVGGREAEGQALQARAHRMNPWFDATRFAVEG